MGIDKKACRDFLEPKSAPHSDCGLFLVQSLQYIVRTAVKLVGHRRLLILYLYARADTPDGRPKLTYTMFQASDSFITYDHHPDVKTKWRTAMLENLERDYDFVQNKCAFYSRPDEERVISFCKPYVEERLVDTGFRAINWLQTKLRDEETRRRQKRREQKIHARLKILRPLPRDVESWLRQEVLPAYFFYDYKKGKKTVNGICSACGREIELTGVRHNAVGICPHCGRQVTMKSNGKRGRRIWDRTTASIVQKLSDTELIIRVVKAYLVWPKDGPGEMDCYEETRIIVGRQENGDVGKEIYHQSWESAGITSWKNGYPPVSYLYQRNFNAETCGYLYCRNLDRELKGTLWQYCQLKEFYQAINAQMEVLPYLEGYPAHPRLEHLVKIGFYRLASDLVYRGNINHTLDESQKRTHQILHVMAEDIPFLRGLDIGMELLRKFQKYCSMNLKSRQELLLWQMEHQVEFDILQILAYMTPHKMIRFLGEQYPLLCEKKAQYGGKRYSSMQDMVREYRDYLEMCAKENYDMGNSFVLYPKDLQTAHDKVARRIKQRADAKMRRDFKAACRRIMAQLDFEMDGMKIVYPSTSSDIIAEGHALHHCVGSYVERVAKQECIILFLRKCEEEEKPFYTIEVRNKKVVQVRGMQNTDATPEVKKFMSQWEKRVLTRPEMPQAA